MKAVWHNYVLAESDKTIEVEGNTYFPPESIRDEYLRKSYITTSCPWKGQASYYDIVVEEDVNREAAWYYAEPKKEARSIKGYVAFWKGVKIVH